MKEFDPKTAKETPDKILNAADFAAECQAMGYPSEISKVADILPPNCSDHPTGGISHTYVHRYTCTECGRVVKETTGSHIPPQEILKEIAAQNYETLNENALLKADNARLRKVQGGK